MDIFMIYENYAGEKFEYDAVVSELEAKKCIDILNKLHKSRNYYYSKINVKEKIDFSNCTFYIETVFQLDDKGYYDFDSFDIKHNDVEYSCDKNIEIFEMDLEDGDIYFKCVVDDIDKYEEKSLVKMNYIKKMLNQFKDNNLTNLDIEKNIKNLILEV